MEKDYAIEIKNLSKTYKVYRHPSDLLKEIIFRKVYHENFEALKNINLSIKKGEVVGIIGRNGSGKSTLLKILAGTLDKTNGSVVINGRVSAILDLGLGFNPEYSGRQNIYNGAMVLGMTRKEIERKVKKIIEFSELREFIDRPFKTYSTGMQARLTFSVASEIEPDILIIDEALAAGDMFFMAKCIDKMVEMCQSGATIIIVSHSTFLIRRLCTRTILLEKGQIIKDGGPDDVCTHYEMGLITEESRKIKKRNRERPSTRITGSGEIEIIDVKVYSNGKEKYSIMQHDDLSIRLFYKTKQKIENPTAYVLISRDDGVLATSYFTGDPNYINIGTFEGRGYVDFVWKDTLLGDGQYLITAAFYPNMKGADSIQKQMLAPYTFHDKGWGFKVQRKGRSLQSLFDQKVKVVNNHIK